MDKRFKPLKRITVEESHNYISTEDDFRNSLAHFYTLSPSIHPDYPASEGWEDVKYFTKRPKKSVPSDGQGDELIYVLSNPTYPGLLKIGYTRKEIGIRIKDLSKATGVPTPFKLEYIFRCSNGMELESEIHRHLKEFRPNNQREFFDITLNQAVEAVKFLGGNHN
jgi:hypothetical protein